MSNQKKHAADENYRANGCHEHHCHTDQNHQHERQCNHSVDHDEHCACHQHTDEYPKLTITTDQGEELLCDVLAIYPHDNESYIALLAEGQEDVYIYRYQELGDEVALSSIESDREYDAAGRAFMDIWQDESVT